MEEIPRVLIAAPTSELHDYIIRRYLENLNKFTYPNFDVLLIDTSKNGDYMDKIDFYMRVFFSENLYSNRTEIDQIKSTENVFETLANARNKIIEYMLESNYDYLFSLDTDTLPPHNSIEKLLSYKKDIVGFWCDGFTGKLKKPIIIKDSSFVRAGKRGMNYYTEEEVRAFKGLTKIWATSVGCLLISRKVFEAGVRFKYTNTFNVGEDVWFFVEANSAGFEFWVDPFKVIHENKTKIQVADTMRTVKKLQEERISLPEVNTRLKVQELKLNSLVRILKEKKVI